MPQKKSDSSINVFRVPLTEDFMEQWVAYSLFQNNVYLRYIEILIMSDKELKKHFIYNTQQDTNEVKFQKKMLDNILRIKEKGHTDWLSMKDLVPEFVNQEDGGEELGKKFRNLVEKPNLSIDQFITLFDEKIKQFITANHIQSFVDVLYRNQDKIDSIQNLDYVNKKFNDISYSYIEKVSNVIQKNNTQTLSQENIDEKIEEIISINSNSFKLHETIKTGFQTLDNIVYTNGGFQKSRFYLISGKTGFGKSQFLINLTKNFLAQGKFVLFLTLENTLEETNDRLFSCITGNPLSELYTKPKESKEMVVNFFKEFKGTFVCEHLPQNSLTKQMVDTMVKIKKDHVKKTPDVIIIDYLDLMLYPEKLEERVRLARLSNQMKQIQQETNTVVISPTQLNRQSYKDKEVDLDNISESSGKAWVQDSVLILNGTKEQVQKGIIELIVQKNRHGKSQTKVLFHINFDIMSFLDTGKHGYEVHTEMEKEMMGSVESSKGDNDLDLW